MIDKFGLYGTVGIVYGVLIASVAIAFAIDRLMGWLRRKAIESRIRQLDVPRNLWRGQV